MANTFLSAPSLSGTMDISSLYQVMGVGLTDTILLLGHADATVMYEPYQVLDPKQAVKFLNSDSNSPLLRSFLEVYNAGCKDIWLMAVAPMSEYEQIISERLTVKVAFGNKTFYQRYNERLNIAYTSLSGHDFAEIIVPVEAVFYDAGGIDFLTPLINFCAQCFSVTGSVCLGVLGTRISTFNAASITAMVADSRLPLVSSSGKFVMIVVGEGILSQSQMSNTYAASLAVTVAALLATSDLDRSVIGLPLPNVSALVGNDLTADKVEQLSQAKLNVAGRTTRGKRGYAYQTRLLTDNTLGQDNSDFWSMAQMHVVANVINQVRAFGFSYIGTVYLSKFKETVYNYLTGLTRDGYIRDFSLTITEEDHGQKALVYISIVPIFGIRQITFQIEVGPGA